MYEFRAKHVVGMVLSKKTLHCGVLIVKNLLNIHISEISANEYIPYSHFNICEYTGRHLILDLLADKNGSFPRGKKSHLTHKWMFFEYVRG